MRDSSETVCFTCGLPSGEFPRLNHLPSGQVCPSCRDRLLAALPPILPALEDELEQVAGMEGEVEVLEPAPLQLSPRETTWGPRAPDTPA